MLFENLTGIRKFENMTWLELVKYLESQGFTYHRGMTAHVFVHPVKDYVYKIFVRDYGQMEFLKYVQHAPANKHFPKIYKGPVKIKLLHRRLKSAPDYVWLVKMEKLYPLTPDAATFVNHIYDALEPIISKEENPTFPATFDRVLDLEPSYPGSDSISYEEYFKKYEKFDAKNFVLLCRKLALDVGRNFNIDIHSDNILMRHDGTLVIVDPFSEAGLEGADYNTLDRRPTVRSHKQGHANNKMIENYSQMFPKLTKLLSL